MEAVILLIVWIIICGGIGFIIGDLANKQNGALGAMLGAGLGPIGWIIAAVLPKSENTGQDTPTPKKTPEQERIEKLEAELAQVKAGLATKRDDDGEIPTYRLD